MPDIRPLNKDKYNISKHRFLEIYHFCMQYGEWKDELHCNLLPAGIDYSKERVQTSPNGDSMDQLVARRIDLQKKCELIEQTAMEADGDIYQYILKGATNEYASFKYLKMSEGMPCERDMYYDRRLKFYWLMSTKM